MRAAAAARALLLAALLAATAAAQRPRVAVLYARSGDGAVDGARAAAAAMLAQGAAGSDDPAAGLCAFGGGGGGVAVVLADTGSTPAGAVRAALDEGDGAAALVGPGGSDAAAAVALLDDGGARPWVAYAATAEALRDREAFPGLRHEAPGDAAQGRALAAAARALGLGPVAVLAEDTAYGRGLAAAFGEAAAEAGLALADEAAVPLLLRGDGGEEDAARVREGAAAAGTLLLAASAGAARRVLAAAERNGTAGAGSGVQWLATDAWASDALLWGASPELQRAAAGVVGVRPAALAPAPAPAPAEGNGTGAAAEPDTGAWFAALYAAEAPRMADELGVPVEALDVDGAGGAYAARAYDAVCAVARAVNEAGEAGAVALLEALDAGASLRGASPRDEPRYEVWNAQLPRGGDADDAAAAPAFALVMRWSDGDASPEKVADTQLVPGGPRAPPQEEEVVPEGYVSTGSPVVVIGAVAAVFGLVVVAALCALGVYCRRVGSLEEQVQWLVHRLAAESAGSAVPGAGVALAGEGGGEGASSLEGVPQSLRGLKARSTLRKSDMDKLLQSPMERIVGNALAVRASLESRSHWFFGRFKRETEERRMLDELVESLTQANAGDLHQPQDLRAQLEAGHLDGAVDDQSKRWLYNEVLGGGGPHPAMAAGAAAAAAAPAGLGRRGGGELGGESPPDSPPATVDRRDSARSRFRRRASGRRSQRYERLNGGESSEGCVGAAGCTGADGPALLAAGAGLGGGEAPRETSGRVAAAGAGSDADRDDEAGDGSAGAGDDRDVADANADAVSLHSVAPEVVDGAALLGESPSATGVSDAAAASPSQSVTSFGSDAAATAAAAAAARRGSATLSSRSSGKRSLRVARRGSRRAPAPAPAAEPSPLSRSSSASNDRLPHLLSARRTHMSDAKTALRGATARRASSSRPRKRGGGGAGKQRGGDDDDDDDDDDDEALLDAADTAASLLSVSRMVLDLGLAKLGHWDFDIFTFSDRCGEPDTPWTPMSAIGFTLLSRFDLVNKLALDRAVVVRAMRRIESGYHAGNPFHNSLHGADVAQSVCFFLSETGLQHQMAAHELLAVIVAGLCHDIDHPGATNQFLINTGDELALRYNDIAVLENHHAARTLQLMRRPDVDLFATLTPAERKAVRSLVISLILATDLKSHYDIVNDFKRRTMGCYLIRNGRVAPPSQPATCESETGTAAASARRGKRFTVPPGSVSIAIAASPTGAAHARRRSATFAGGRRPSGPRAAAQSGAGAQGGEAVPVRGMPRMDGDTLLATLKMALKCSDLGHPAKAWRLHNQWSDRLREEFFRQGDRERELGLEVSPFMDRERDRLNHAQNQVGFFNFLVVPMWESFTRLFSSLSACEDELHSNLARWKSLKRASQQLQESTAAKEAAKAKAEPAQHLPTLAEDGAASDKASEAGTASSRRSAAAARIASARTLPQPAKAGAADAGADGGGNDEPASPSGHRRAATF